MIDDVTRRALRFAMIAGATDCVMTVEEAAAFLGISENTLRASDVPRTRAFGRSQYLKSECIKFIRARLTHTVELTEKAS